MLYFYELKLFCIKKPILDENIALNKKSSKLMNKSVMTE